MTERGLVRRFVLLRALRWLPLGLGLPFFVLLPLDRGLGLGEIGVVFAPTASSRSCSRSRAAGSPTRSAAARRCCSAACSPPASLAGFGLATGAGRLHARRRRPRRRPRPHLRLARGVVRRRAARRSTPDTPLHGPLAKGSTRRGGRHRGSARPIGGLLPLLAPGLPEHGDELLLDLSVPFLAGAVAAARLRRRRRGLRRRAAPHGRSGRLARRRRPRPRAGLAPPRAPPQRPARPRRRPRRRRRHVDDRAAVAAAPRGPARRPTAATPAVRRPRRRLDARARRSGRRRARGRER